jgi:hypothetical protein
VRLGRIAGYGDATPAVLLEAGCRSAIAGVHIVTRLGNEFR